MDTNTAPFNLDERPTFESTVRSIDDGYFRQAFRICIETVCITSAALIEAENAAPLPQNWTLRHHAIKAAHIKADEAAWSALMNLSDVHTALQVAVALKALA